MTSAGQLSAPNAPADFRGENGPGVRSYDAGQHGGALAGAPVTGSRQASGAVHARSDQGFPDAAIGESPRAPTCGECAGTGKLWRAPGSGWSWRWCPVCGGCGAKA